MSTLADDLAADQLEVPGADTTPAPEPDPKPRRRRTRKPAGETADSKRPRSARPPRKPSTAAQVKASVVTVHQLAAMGATIAGKPQTGAVLEGNAQQAADVWAQLAARYPAIERILVGGGDAALFGALLGVYVPVVMTALSEPRDPAAAAGMLGMFGLMGGGQPPAPEQPYAV